MLQVQWLENVHATLSGYKLLNDPVMGKLVGADDVARQYGRRGLLIGVELSIIGARHQTLPREFRRVSFSPLTTSWRNR